MSANSAVMSFAARPSKQARPQAGNTIAVEANVFPLDIDENTAVHHYDVQLKFGPRMKMRMPEYHEVFDAAVKQFPQVFTNKDDLAFDDGKRLFAVKKIQFPAAWKVPDEESKFKTVFKHTMVRDKRTDDVEMVVQYVGMVILSTAAESQLSEAMADTMPSQVIDVILQQAKDDAPTADGRSKVIQRRRDFFFMDRVVAELGKGLQLFAGYRTAAHVLGVDNAKRFYLVVNQTQAPFYKAQPVTNFVGDCLGRINLNTPLDDWGRKQFETNIKGLFVFTTHGGNRREYRISGVTRESAKDIKFNHDGKQISVVQYFKSTFNIALNHPNLNCLYVRRGKPPAGKEKGDGGPIYLPMEVCTLVYGQRSGRRLGGQQAQQMIKASCVEAPIRRKQILDLLERSKLGQDSISLAFGVQLCRTPVMMSASILATPSFEAGSTTQSAVKGSFTITRFHRPVPNAAYVLISGEPEAQAKMLLMAFCEALGREAHTKGMKLGMPEAVAYADGVCTMDFAEAAVALEKLFVTAVNHCKKRRNKCDFALIVLPHEPEASDWFFHTSRDICFKRLGIMKQCMKAVNALSGDVKSKSVAQNVVLELNAKLGGVNQAFAPADSMSKLLMAVPTLVLAVDCVRMNVDGRRTSVLAVVGYFNLCEWKMASQIRIIDTDDELKQGLLTEIFEAMLQTFIEKYKSPPKRVLLLRGNVPPGDMRKLAAEIGDLNVATANCRIPMPKLLYVVVQKDHNVRFFCKSEKDQMGRGKNVPGGTLVNTTIVDPKLFDFYLCSHVAIQGTARPNHYTVIVNDNGFSEDEAHMLMHNMCFLDAVCTRVVATPVPLRYAGKVCERIQRDLAHNGVPDSAASVDGEEAGMHDRGFTPQQLVALREGLMVKSNLQEEFYFL